MSGRMSRNKGQRVERLLRDELIRYGWEGVVKVPLSGAVKTRAEYDADILARPKGFGQELAFECKARAAGFDKIYELLEWSKIVSFSEKQVIIIASLHPDAVINVANRTSVPDISTFDKDKQKVMRSMVKKCQEWIGTSQILALKQDRKSFIYIRYYG